MNDLLAELTDSLRNIYSIERELGGGGMSRVFLAEELALKRRVVIKLLPPELVGHVSSARFEREIGLAARLQHPHIVPLISVGAVGDVMYYTMPFVEGESLHARIATGPVSTGDAISILRDVARALDYAHGKNVTHRDIKPENILLAGSSAVITDFGIARAVEESAVHGGLTSASVAIGTPAYMAPEQITADPSMDYRADIYSLGATGYEMLTGKPPFAGRSIQALIAAHVLEAPPTLKEVRPDLPAALSDLVMRCLAKDPDERPQTAREVAETLDSIPNSGSADRATLTSASSQTSLNRGDRRFSSGRVWATAIATCILLAFGFFMWRAMPSGNNADAAVRSIAVLPFENTSGDSTFDYLEDGLSDQVRDALNAIPQLTVKARNSSRQLKGQSAKYIGENLGVGAVLQGAVSRSRSHLHVTAELVRTSDDVALWSGSFDGQPEELTGIQNQISEAVAAKLRISGVTPALIAARSGRGTTDSRAYELFLQGRHAYDRLEYGRAADFFQQAVKLDPRFGRAHGYLAMSFANSPVIGMGPVDVLNSRARASAALALSLDSSSAEAYATLAFALMNELRLGESVAPFEKAMKLDSTTADIVASYAMLLSQVGRLDEAAAYALRARDQDPFSSSANGILSYILYMQGRYDDALAAVKAALALAPENPISYQSLGYIFAFKGMPDSAVAAFETGFKLGPQLFNGRSNFVFAYAAAGRWDDAVRERTLANADTRRDSPNYRRSIIHIAFGEYDAAVTDLQRAVADREGLVGVASIPCDPLFDPLKTNPKFASLVERVGARQCPPRARWPIAASRSTVK